MTEISVRTGDAASTRQVAAAVAAHLRPGDVVSLAGELGAGKTCFVQGAASALGVSTPVTSPTFVLVRDYPGRIPVIHCDVYRLGTLQDVLDLGDDVFAPDVVTFVEWGDAIAGLLPPDRLDVVLRHLDEGAATAATPLARDGDATDDAVDDGEVPLAGPRALTLHLHGRFAERADALRAALSDGGDA